MTGIITRFVQKIPFKIHKLFTNTCNMARKSNTKVHNSSAHPVKGHNPYCSRWLMHSISQNWWEVHSLWFRTAKQNLNWKCSFWLISWEFSPSVLKTTKLTNFHRPHSVFRDFHGLEKRFPFFPNFQRPSKTVWTLPIFICHLASVACALKSSVWPGSVQVEEQLVC